MTPPIGINGFGRIGRNYLRFALKHGHEVAAINDITDTGTLAHLLRYDSTYGRPEHQIDHDETALIIDGRSIPVTSHCAGVGTDGRVVMTKVPPNSGSRGRF